MEKTHRISKALGAYAVILGLAGCAQPTPPYYMTPPGGSILQRDRDAYECERDARLTPGNACSQIDMYKTCMASKGYKPQPESGNPGMCR